MIAVVGEPPFDAHVDGDEFRLFPRRSRCSHFFSTAQSKDSPLA
jgi:hypothetical protein